MYSPKLPKQEHPDQLRVVQLGFLQAADSGGANTYKWASFLNDKEYVIDSVWMNEETKPGAGCNLSLFQVADGTAKPTGALAAGNRITDAVDLNAQTNATKFELPISTTGNNVVPAYGRIGFHFSAAATSLVDGLVNMRIRERLTH